MVSERPPIRIVTRLLAEMQTAVIARGLQLTDGDLDRFAILSLIVRQTATDRGGRGEVGDPVSVPPLSVMSIANSLSRPYETVRRHVVGLVAAGWCQRSARGVTVTTDAAARAAIDTVLAAGHDALVRFIADLKSLQVAMPATRPGIPYRPEAGMAASIDIMLSVLDGNRQSHDEWVQLVLFSVVLAGNVHPWASDPAVAARLRDETQPTPAGLMRPVTVSQARRLIGLAETTVRRHVAAMARDGRLERGAAGWVVSEVWLNRPENVRVSRASVQAMRRVFERLAASGFRFDDPASAYIVGRPADVVGPG